ncbi:MAG TPA: winged helix-turn-helix domain-containing protein [Gallionella sp.]|nr:winged helix-turn-helix domain-containing protein [Gallionella sp.]
MSALQNSYASHIDDSNRKSPPLVAGGLSLSDDTGRVMASGISILLRPIEFRLLRFLMSHPERVHTRAELLEQAWGRKVFVGERTIDVHIRRLRVSLQPFGMDRWIRTVHTRGYSFSTQYQATNINSLKETS